MEFLKGVFRGLKWVFICLSEKVKPKPNKIVRLWEGTGWEQDFKVSAFCSINHHAKCVDRLQLADKNDIVLADAHWFKSELRKDENGKVFQYPTPCKETWFKEMTESALKTVAENK